MLYFRFLLFIFHSILGSSSSPEWYLQTILPQNPTSIKLPELLHAYSQSNAFLADDGDAANVAERVLELRQVGGAAKRTFHFRFSTVDGGVRFRTQRKRIVLVVQQLVLVHWSFVAGLQNEMPKN